MSEEKNNVEMITEFKMYITDLETERDSKEIDVSDLIFNDYIEFEFGNYEDEDYETLTYKDFKFFINDYSITIYSPQMEELQNQLQQKENIIKEVREYIEKYDFITGYYEHNYDDGNDTYTHYTVKEELLEILDKENK